MKKEFDFFDYLIKTKDIIGYFKHHYQPIKDYVDDNYTFYLVGDIEFYILEDKLYYNSVEIIDNHHLDMVFLLHNYKKNKEYHDSEI